MTEPVAVGEYPGVSIAYYEAPYRHYTVNAKKVPSVTTVLGVLDKSGPLMHYTERVTSEGLRSLVLRDGYRVPSDMRVPKGARAFRLPPRVTDSTADGEWLFSWRDVDAASKSDGKSLIRVKKDSATLTGARIMLGHLAQLGLDQRSQTNRAADRGVDVHQIWQDWNERRLIPDASKYPKDRHGYIRACAAAIMELQPKAVETEAVVGSAVHGFAGRLDTVVVVATADGLSMIDVKTSKAVYPNSHFPQLAGYEIARQECGLPPTVRQGILRLGADGKFELVWSDAVADDFLAILSTWKSQSKWARR